MKKKSGNIYTNLDIDIPTVKGVLIEKFKEPVIIDNRIEWYDKNELLHSFHGFPSRIIVGVYNYNILWHVHGECIKLVVIEHKSESKIIAEKIQDRNFARRAKG